jgi:hypothetical protein
LLQRADVFASILCGLTILRDHQECAALMERAFRMNFDPVCAFHTTVLHSLYLPFSHLRCHGLPPRFLHQTDSHWCFRTNCSMTSSRWSTLLREESCHLGSETRYGKHSQNRHGVCRWLDLKKHNFYRILMAPVNSQVPRCTKPNAHKCISRSPALSTHRGAAAANWGHIQ